MKLFLIDHHLLPYWTRAGAPLAAALLALLVCAMPQSTCAADDATMQLAAKIAASETGHEGKAQDLVAAYEKVYGKIGNVPDRWPALVRRVLVCQHAHDQICVHSSILKLKQESRIDALALNHLVEVSRFGMHAESIREQLHGAEASNAVDTVPASSVKMASAQVNAINAPKATEAPVKAGSPAPASVSPQVVAPMNGDVDADPPPAIAPAPAAAPAPVTVSAHAGINAANSSPKSTFRTTQPKSLMQRASSKLSRMASTNAAGFFLDALFIMAAVALLLAYLLYRAMRGRSQERRERLRALQEIQRLEELRDEDRVAAEHDLWSERLKAEVAIEAQKSHAEDLRRLAQKASDETIHEERELAAAAIKAERERYEQLLEAERARATDALKTEQAKIDDAVKSARFRADQAIDAYDQMAARELVYAHKHNDDLQEALNTEQARREELEMKAAEALQTIETMKVKERKLLAIIKAEQQVRISETRQSAEKLKAAQQAAIALHQSLTATRAMKADLERRAEEAARAAELRLAQVRQQVASTPAASNTQAMPESVHAATSESELPPAKVVLKDLFSR